MGSDKFRLKLVIRIILILALGFGTIYVLTQTHYWLVSIWSGLFFILLIFELIRYLEKSKKELANFLLAIQQGDFSNAYPQKRKKESDYSLYKAFNIINSEFQKIRREKESNFHYLQAIVEHSGVALICYQEEEGEINLMNKAAKELFRKPYLKNISSFQKIDPALLQAITRLNSGDKVLLKSVINNELLHLSILAKELRLDDALYKLVSFQDIKTELDEHEIDSWQKLIRVLTHEIMNSAIPISTLTSVINQKLINIKNTNSLAQLSTEDEEDILGGLKTIENRSKGLIQFVESYKTLAQLPKPKFETMNVNELFNRVTTLLKSDIEKAKISFKIDLDDKKMAIKADPQMIEQILINLIMNAKDSLTGVSDPVIELMADNQNDKDIIRVIDNGCGMDTETLNNIYVPFYTTKKKGSGIGLSLSRQIMRLHKGSISVQSEPGKGSVFNLEF